MRFGPKYRNHPTKCREDVLHHSKLEARRCDELHLLQQGGEISGLQAHPQKVYRLEVNGHLICKVQPDFEFTDRDGNVVTQDAKGILTDASRIKYALFEAIYGRPVELVRRVR